MKKLFLLTFILVSILPAIANSQNTSEIYFYRLPNYVGSGVKMSILVDGQPVVKLKNGCFYRHQVQAGDHIISFGFGSSSRINIKAESGKAYYISCHYDMGFWSGVPLMELADASAARSIVESNRLKEQQYEPVIERDTKSYLGISVSGGIGFEKYAWFVDEKGKDVTLSTGSGFGIGAEYGYRLNRSFELAVNCSYYGSTLSENLKNASASFNRMGINLTPSFIIPVKGGDMFRFKLGAGAGANFFGTMKVDASQLGDTKYTFKYKWAPGFHTRLLFEYNFMERATMGFGVGYNNIHYKYTETGSTHVPNATEDKLLSPDGSGISFILNTCFLF